jgi:hypothetical protein
VVRSGNDIVWTSGDCRNEGKGKKMPNEFNGRFFQFIGQYRRVQGGHVTSQSMEVQVPVPEYPSPTYRSMSWLMNICEYLEEGEYCDLAAKISRRWGITQTNNGGHATIRLPMRAEAKGQREAKVTVLQYISQMVARYKELTRQD